VDFVGPRVRIVGPAEGARLHRLRTVRSHGRRHRVANVLRLSGRVDDPGGVADVGVTLRRVGARGATACTFLDGAARRFVTLPCAAQPVIGATLDGGAWSWHTAAGLKMPRGSWELTVRATDRAGNPSTAVLHFTVT
jgi:hypothetical protein